jgi:hypothetical protein
MDKKILALKRTKLKSMRLKNLKRRAKKKWKSK